MLKLNYFVPAIALSLSLSSCGGGETEKEDVVYQRQFGQA